MVDVVKNGINPQLRMPRFSHPMAIICLTLRSANGCGQLAQLTPVFVDEINNAVHAELGDFSGWKEVTAMSFFGSVAHRTASRAVIGEELCRDERFIRLSMSFIQSIFLTALVIVNLPFGPLRGLLAWPLSLLHRWKLRRCTIILLPIVKRRIEDRAAADKDGAPRFDAIEWTLAYSKPDSPNNTSECVTKALLHNLWAGSSAPGGLITEMVFELLLEPQYLDPLRVEAANALRAHGWSEKMLESLYLQEGFIREINRLFPTGSSIRSILSWLLKVSNASSHLLPHGTRSALLILRRLDVTGRITLWVSHQGLPKRPR
ncbi:MAG: hypothetical protein Q9187_000339 [Circinaria calcarea]